MTERYEPSPRTTPARGPSRVTYDRSAVHAVLDEAVLCHVGFVVDGAPIVLPQLHARVGEVLYLHGSTGARALLAARGPGLAVCVTVTLLDGLVFARSAFHHSINYRSVVVHGVATVVEEPTEKYAALTAVVAAVAAGRGAGCRAPDRRELAATTVLRVPLAEVSLKVRSGGPQDDEADLDLPYWAGVLPLHQVSGPPEPAPDLLPGTDAPEHVTGWSRPTEQAG